MNKKLILFMTSLSLAMTPIGVFASTPAATIEAVEERAFLQAVTGEYRTWKQGDSRWASKVMAPGGDTMYGGGCLVTAIAALMVHSGCADEATIDPGKLCDYLVSNGGFTGSSELYWGKINGAVDGFKLANWSVALSGSRYDKVAQIRSYLDSGYYIVASVGSGAHWVAVDSADGSDNINIIDPAYSYTKLFGDKGYSDSGVTRIALFAANGGSSGSSGQTDNSNVESYTAQGVVNVGASYLNVRIGMGTEHDYLRDGSGNQITLQNGAEVNITGKGTSSSGELWYRVNVNGLTGYVSGAYIDISSNNNGGNTDTAVQEIPAIVTESYVNIRSGAGTNYSVLAVAQRDEQITILAQAQDGFGALWYKINYKGTVGYMHSDYVSPVENNANDNNTAGTPGKVNASSVNIRSGAGTNYTVLSVANLNDEITILGEAQDAFGVTWYKINHNGTVGYMHSDYVTNNSVNNNSSAYTEIAAIVNASSVNVRSGAGTNNSVLATLALNTSITVIGEAQDGNGATWYKIRYSGGEGYMISDYVTIGQDNGTSSGMTTETRNGTVNGDYVNVRTGAGTNYDRITSLNSGTPVTITGEERDGGGSVWYKINYAGGSGYMISDYITINDGNYGNAGGNSAASYPTEGIEGKEGVINTSDVKVYSGADAGSSVTHTLSFGVSVLIESAGNDGSGNIWYKVGFAGTGGYVMAQYINIQ